MRVVVQYLDDIHKENSGGKVYISQSGLVGVRWEG